MMPVSTPVSSPERVSEPLALRDIFQALKQGLADFLRAPLMGLFFGSFFAFGGVFIWWALHVAQKPWLMLPVVMGFPLIGPFAAVGTYEISRRLQAGEPLRWGAVLGVVFSQGRREVLWMAFVVLFIFWIWMYQVRLLMALFLGLGGFASLEGFLITVTTTSSGLLFLGVGTLVGALLSSLLFCTTVVSIPLLLEREIDVVSAIITSFRTVFENPLPLLFWGFLVALLTFAALAPLFLGLLIVFPVLGHATWHLYKKALGSPVVS